MTKTEAFNIAEANLIRINNINTYVDSIMRHFFPISTNCNNLIKENRKANSILLEIQKAKTLRNLDRYLSFWVYEVSNSPLDSVFFYNGLLSKLDAIVKVLSSRGRTEILKYNLAPIKNELIEHESIRAKYKYEEDDVIIVTAVPEEFKAVVRKISIILNLLNRVETEKILNPDTDPESLKKRNKTWIEGVIIRDDKWVKVRVLLTEEYGSVAAIESLANIKQDYNYNNEILIVGIAGHLDKTERIKIGDLVISDSYYSAYLFKDIQEVNSTDGSIINGASYNDKKLKPLSEEYNVDGCFNWETWQPRNMVTTRPSEINPSRHSDKFNVYKGAILSGPSVVKQDFKKKDLQDNFEDVLAVEMEAHGCYSFAKNIKDLNVKVIKGLCDWANHEKEKSWQPFCSELAAEFTIDYLIAKYGKPIT